LPTHIHGFYGNAISSSSCKTLDGGMIIRKDMVGSGHGLILDITPEFSWRD
jgi:hypothetical protein